MSRYQFVWYGFHWRNWLRMFIENPYFPVDCRVYRWRVAIGPIDVRRRA